MSLTIDKYADDCGIRTAWERDSAEKRELRKLKRRQHKNRREVESVQDTNRKAA